MSLSRNRHCYLTEKRKKRERESPENMATVFTCNSCALQFTSSEDQRSHMKTDWHRYNLKRRAAQLAPISQKLFESKVQIMSGENGTASNKQMTKKAARRMEKEALLEKKKKLLELARASILKNMQQQAENGISSTSSSNSGESLKDSVVGGDKATVKTDKRLGNDNVSEDISRKEEEQEEEEEGERGEEDIAEKLMELKLKNKVDIPLEECLFCTKKRFHDFETNLDHMFKFHGFYIPEQKYLVDKEGLVRYMSEKIGLGNVCIVCNYQGRSLEAVRAHMNAKRHCRIPYETEDEKLELAEFYDFTKSYEGLRSERGDPTYTKNGKTNTLASDTTTRQTSDTEADGDEDEEWEDIGSEDEETEGEGGEEAELSPEEYIYNDGVELHLPTGIKVGHRSLQRYYKQNLKPEKELTEGQGTLVAAETRSFVPAYDKRAAQVRQRVWEGERRDQKREEKRSARHINHQLHYRDQLLQ